MASDRTLTFTDATFEADVVGADIPVLVDFWGRGCGPCEDLAPTIDALAGEYEGKVKIGKLDVHANSNTPGRFRIRGIPALLLFKDGAVVAQRVGTASKSELRKMIEPHI